MNGKKIQAHMQLNVDFVGNATKLVKDLESKVSGLQLNSGLTKGIEANLNKSIHSLYNNLEKMGEGLSRKGLNVKQYTNFFDNINKRVEDTTKVFETLKEDLQAVFDSKENKEAIKNLELYKKQLEQIKSLASDQKEATTRRGTAIGKMKDELGLDYNISKKMLQGIATRRANKQKETKDQSEWLDKVGLDETKLKRALELLKQIENQQSKIEGYDTQAEVITGKKTVSGSATYLSKQIETTSNTAYLPETHKENLAVLKQQADVYKEITSLSNTLYTQLNNELPKATAEAERLAQAEMNVKEILGQFGISFSVAGIIQQFKELIEYSYQFYKSLDSALNSIYVVSDLSAEAVNNLTTSFISMAKRTGMALDDITVAATLFYQQGLNTDEVLEMTEVTSEFAKVAGIDAADAADKLTAAVNGYCLAAEDAALVADKFNQVAAQSAADIDELSTAFSKAAAQANQAGVGMDNYLAYIATMVEATREAPENIGTSLKTIFSRMQQVKEAGTTEDGETDVNQVETALESVGVALRDANGELRDLEEVFAELGPKWNSLDRNTQAYIGTIVAGTRQQSRFITLMQNWDRVLELAAESENSAGMQALMHAKAMESVESKTQQLNVAWQEFVSNLTDSSVIKGVISTLTSLLNTINSGAAPMRLLSAAVIIFRKQITKGTVEIVKWTKRKLDAFKADNRLGKGLKGTVNSLRQQITAFKNNRTQIQKNTAEIVKLEKEAEKTKKAMDRLTQANAKQADPQFVAKMNKKRNAYAKVQTQIAVLNAENDKLVQENDAIAKTMDSITTVVQGVNVGFTMLAGSSNKVAAAFGKFGQFGTSMLTILLQGKVAMNSFSKATKKMSAEVKAELISTGIGALVVILGEAIKLVYQLWDAFSVSDTDLANSVEAVGDALGEYSNSKTIVKSVESAIKQYEKLANKVYLTAAEQEKMNSLAQQLGDSLEIETVEDQYGNLSVSMLDVEQKLEGLRAKAEEARKELIKTEQEQIEAYDHNGHVDDFYEKYLKSHKSDIRSAMSDIETGIDDEELMTSATNVQNIMDNLKNNVIQNSSEMVEAFGGAGVHWSLTEDVESMMDAFNNADIDSSQWNSLYQTFDLLQGKIDELSYDEALDVVGSAVESWGKAAGLTTEQVNLMKDSIMDTLYADSNLHKTVSGYDEQMSKMDGSYFTKQLADYEKEKDRLYREADNNGEWDLWNPFNESDQEREYEVQQNKISILKDEQKAYEKIAKYDKEITELEELGLTNLNQYNNLVEKRNKLAEEYGAASREEMQRMEKLREISGKMSDNSAAWFNNAGLFDEDAFDLLTQMNDSGELDNILGAYTEDEQKGTRLLTDYLVNVINNTDDEEMKKVAQDKLNNVFESIEIKATMSWGNLHSELDGLSSDLRKMNSLIEEFNEAGGFSLDTFANLCDILDSIDLATVFDTGAMDQYLGALDNLELGFDASTGMITANGDALKSLQDIQMVATQAKLAQTAQSLEADKASLQSQIYGIEAEIAANQSLIEWLKTQTDTEVKLSDVKVQGEQYYTSAMQAAAVETGKLYQDMTSASKAWAEASMTNAAKLGNAIKAAMSGSLGTGNLSAYMDGLIDGGDITYEKTGSYGQLQLMQKDGKINVQAAIKQLEEYNQKGLNTIDKLRSQMKGIEQMQSLLTTMSKADLSKLGTDVDKEELDKYIGKLKEIYNILNRIQNLEHRLSTLDTYSEIAVGEDYGKYYQQRLQYTQELSDQYKFLVTEQKKFTNGYMDFIEKSAVADVFDFDEFGQIIIDFEKYNALQDTAADGEKSLKEQADELYETYTEMYEELQGYFDEYITYLQKAIELHEEAIDSYIEVENTMAEAIKEIYQKMLDTKLEAIDREKEALEELREAREQARKDRDNAEAISGLQTNLQRAMMDTSGASDISLIKAQKDMNDKLEDIAEDKYGEMLDNIIAQLDEEQEALQDNFDQMFENTEWLFAFIEDNIMNDQQKIEQILTQTDEWQQQSNLERSKKLEELGTNYETYMAAMRGGKGEGSTIYDVWNRLGDLKNATEALDEALKTREINVGSAVANAVAEGIKTAAAAYTNGTQKNQSPTTPKEKDPYTPTITTDDTKNTDTWTVILQRRKDCKDLKVKAGQSVTLPKLADEGGYTHSGWQLPDGKVVAPGKSFTPTANGQTVVSIWLLANASFKPQLNGGQNPFAFPNTTIPGLSTGGLVKSTGVAMLHGTINEPELVLNSLQTKHFMDFTQALDDFYSKNNYLITRTSYENGNVTIGSIEFNVDSMSSIEDGRDAFAAFVDEFKKIGDRTGIKINTFKNTL